MFSWYFPHPYSVDLQPYNETAYSMFLSNDYNSDGVITLAELESSFDKYDANGKRLTEASVLIAFRNGQSMPSVP